MGTSLRLDGVVGIELPARAAVALAVGVILGACHEAGDVLTPAATGGVTAAGGRASSGGGSAPGGMGGVDSAELAPIQHVAAGNYHTCLIAEGRLYCFGENGQGALGLGDVSSRAAPTPVGGAGDYTAVQAGADFSCAVRAGGETVCFGAGTSGQLGDGSFMGSTTPVPVQLAGSAVALCAGDSHACAIVREPGVAPGDAGSGDLYCWGANAEGQLGQDDPFPDPGVSRAVPVQVAAGEEWSSVSCGQGHTCAIRDDGSLWCWGRNSSGELGLGAGVPEQLRAPQRVGSDVDWVSVAAGQHHTCGIRGSVEGEVGGNLWCWGANASGQLGSSDDTVRHEPASVPGQSSVLHVTTDTFHTCVLRLGGQLLCAGRNAEGQLGTGDIEPRPLFADIDGRWTHVVAGRFHTCAVDEDGAGACTGANAAGQLGQANSERRSVFSRVVGPGD